MPDRKNKLLAAAVLGAGLLFGQPASALTIVVPTEMPPGLGQDRVDLAEPVATGQRHGSRSRQCDGRRSRSQQSCKPRRRMATSYRHRHQPGTTKAWQGIQLCTNCPAFK